VVLTTGVTVLPVLAAASAAWFAGRALGHPDGLGASLGWWALVLATAVAALVAVHRMTRPLESLATLYRLELPFPGAAPSRLRVALFGGAARTPTATPTDTAAHLAALATTLRDHDRRTRGHAERVQAYADLIAADLGVAPDDRGRLRWGALLHDIGKLDVPPALLDAPAPDDEERAALEHHAVRAATLVAPLRPWLGDWLDATTQHHERLDGDGYPEGLRGHEIGLAARIVTVADAYDAMTSPRSYRRPLSTAEARAELVRGSGTQFDPMVVRAFLHVPVGRMHGAAGPLAWLARFPAGGRVLTATGGPTAPAIGALGTIALVAAATLGGLAIRVTDQPEAAAADRPTSTAEPSRGDDDPDGSATTGTTEGGSGHDGDATDGGGRGGGRGEPAGEAAAGTPGDTGTTSTTSGPEPDDPDDPTTTTTEPGDPTTTTEPPGTTTTTAPPGTTTTTTEPNAPPVAAADASSVTVLSTTSIDVLGNDRDDEGLDATTLSITSSPTAGSASVVGGRIRYTAPLLGSSTQVGYRICDDDGACDTAVLTIAIRIL
jgi:hypothetical protein